MHIHPVDLQSPASDRGQLLVIIVAAPPNNSRRAMNNRDGNQPHYWGVHPITARKRRQIVYGSMAGVEG